MGFTVTQICSGFLGLYWLDFSFIYIHYGPDKSGQDSPLYFCFQPSLSVLSFLLSLLLHFLRWGTSTQFIRIPISCLLASTFLVLCKNKCSHPLSNPSIPAPPTILLKIGQCHLLFYFKHVCVWVCVLPAHMYHIGEMPPTDAREAQIPWVWSLGRTFASCYVDARTLPLS